MILDDPEWQWTSLGATQVLGLVQLWMVMSRDPLSTPGSTRLLCLSVSFSLSPPSPLSLPPSLVLHSKVK